MTQVLNVKIAGLFTSPNEFSEVPEGALAEANNIVINQASVAEPRRGFNILASSLASSANKLFFYQSKLFAHSGTSTISYFNASVWNSVSGSYSAPSSTTKVKTAEANQNLYFTTSTGIYKLDAYNATVRRSGSPKSLDTQATTSTSGSTWLTNNYRVAYRVVWGYKDANNNLILGAPSARESIKNVAGATANVSLNFSIPDLILTDGNYANWFYQIYRSIAVDNTSGSTEPNDELGLVYEGNPTATDITNKYVVVSDFTPEALRGATIYTAQSQEGLVNQNEAPPLAKDIAVFKNTTFFANTTSKHRLYITLLAVSASGIVVNDTVTIGGVTYTGKASETTASAQFAVVTSGSASQNIRDTALSLVRVINRYSSSTVYAYYLSGADDLPGKILLEERSIGGSAFTFTSNRYAAWSPTISASSPTRTSSNDNFKNGVFYSKQSQPETAPLPNFFTVGSKDKAIIRIIPLRDSLFVFKEDGIFRISEDANGFQVTLFDSSAKLLAEESPAILNNQIYCLTDQGVCAVTETGVSVVSRPIEQELLSVFSLGLDTVKSSTFGIGYESERKYILFTIASSIDSSPSQAFVWNTFTSTWTKWTLSKKAGVTGQIDVSDSSAKEVLYLADSATASVNVERKSLTYLDYADYYFTTNLLTSVGRVVTVDSGSDNISEGDILFQSSTSFGTVASVVSGQITLTQDSSLSVASVQVLKSIQSSIKWLPMALSNPGISKQFQEVSLIFRTDFSGTASASFSTDLSIADADVTLNGRQPSFWGLFEWSESAIWGGENTRRPVRVWVPRQKQLGTYLNCKFSHSYAFSAWQLEGISIHAETIGSSRVRR